MWLSRDPIAEAGGINLTGFGGANAVNFYDPYGLWGVQFGGFKVGYGDMSLIFQDDEEGREALRGGQSIVWSTLSFGGTDKLGLTESNQYQGGAYTGSRVAATVGREALITAATLGIGNLARAGGATAQIAHKTILVGEAATGGYQAGAGVNKIREGDTLGGSLDILGGSLRVGGSMLGAREVGKWASSADDISSAATKNTSRWTRSDVNGRRVYQRNDLIDSKLVDARGRTNLQRMNKGLAPLGPDGKSMNLHHMTQGADDALAEVTQTFHQANKCTIHINPSSTPSGIDRSAFNTIRSDYWKVRAFDF